MKKRPYPSGVAVWLTFAVVGYAQSSSQPPAAARGAVQPAVEMSPFVITEDAGRGWIATETLAGTRLRTNIQDVPNQIETLTKDFMADLGLTNADQAMIYTANVENLSHDYVTTEESTAYRYPTTAGRIRGIDTGTMSRNFFQASYPSDNFNIERVTVASGPNAVLYGLGSPAGIMDSTPARALMRTQYSFELRFDSEDSKRGTFDANTVVVKDRLAFRIMGLSKREYTDRKPNLDRDERLYATLTFKPFKGTSIFLQGETSDRSWNRAGRYTANDFVSLWYNANQIPGSGYTVPKPVYNNSSLAGIGNNVIFAQAGENPVMIVGVDNVLRSWQNSVTVKNPRQLPGRNVIDAAFQFTVLDPKIFPFDMNDRSTQVTPLTADTRTALIEQKLAPKLFLEMAYNVEKTDGSRRNVGLGVPIADANQFIPGTTTPNPNVGRIYGQGAAGTSIQTQKRDDWRATLSYELDLAQKFSASGGWGKWLGRHNVFGMYNEAKSELRAQTDISRRILDDPLLPGITLRPKTFQNWAIHASRAPQFRQYYTPGNPVGEGGPLEGDWSLNDANGRPFKLYFHDIPFRASDGKRLVSGNQPAEGSFNKIRSQSFAWQGYFLPDQENNSRLITTFGYRKDQGKSATFDVPSLTQDFSGLFPVVWDANWGNFGKTQAGTNRSFGVVARPLKWLSTFYNHSTTFNLNIGRYDPFGNEVPGASGKGKDYGVRIDLWNNRLALRINRYENTAGPVLAAADTAGLRATFFNIESRIRLLDPSAPTINVVDGNRLGFRVAGQQAYNIMGDVESSGYEVELNFAPSRNLNIRVNGAKADAVETNIGRSWIAWAAARLPVWQSVVAKNGEVDGAGRPVTWSTAPLSTNNPTGETLKQYYDSALVGNAFGFMEAAEGRANNVHPLRVNVISRYRFTEGVLKNFDIGGAVRWRGAPTIGYGAKTNATGTILVDTSKPYKGESELYFDAILGYRGTIKAFGGFKYRLQLNVRNVLNEADPIPVTALTTGEVSRIAVVEPRYIACTFGVDF